MQISSYVRFSSMDTAAAACHHHGDNHDHNHHGDNHDSHDHDYQLDPVGLTVRYEMMKLCTGSVISIGHYEVLAVGN